MAIKGKKKSQGKPRRRPAAAPRVQYSHHEHISWYQTSGGRVGIAVGLVLLIGIIAAVVIALTSEPEADVAAQSELDAYTSQTQAVLVAATEAGTGLSGAPTATDDDAFRTLRKDARAWEEGLQSAQLTAAQARPPEGASGVSELILGSLDLYLESTRLYQLAADAEGDLAASLLERAAAQRDLATSLWTNAVALLDEARAEVDLPASSLISPVAAAPAEDEATPEATPSEE
ncbi:MAG: hypothetical protein GEU71_12210 [Actinobacteria bacterium]|nr:hypothetical protein [Actinomycetota bacterium]